MSARSFAILLLICAACGDDTGPSTAPVDDAGADMDFDAGSEESYEDAALPPMCRTHAVDEAADARIKAALCLAMSEPGDFGCTERSETEVLCVGLAGQIVVVFDGEKGVAHYATASAELGTVEGDGPFEITLSGGKTGVCTVEGAALELCI